MNDEATRELARERRLTAELTELLDTDLTTIETVEAPTPSRGRNVSWLAAATLLLGCLATLGVFWAKSRDRTEVQQPTFDPVDPWFEGEWPFRVPFDVLRSRRDVLRLPPDHRRFTVLLRGAEGATALAELLRRERVESLMVVAGDDGEREMPWPDIARHRELRSLLVSGSAAGVRPAALRQLRLLPGLQALHLAHRTTTLNQGLASVLVELPKLRHLTCARIEVTPEGIAALRGLPHLDTLVVNLDRDQRAHASELLIAASKLSTLRALFLEVDSPVDAAALRSLRRLGQLEVLSLTHIDLDDGGLAALPERLAALHLPSLRDVTPRGFTSLGRLRHLRSLQLHAALPRQLQAAANSLLPELRLENFGYLVGEPNAALWQTLQRLAHLRRLNIHTTAESRVATWHRAARCQSLEVLVARVDSLPAAGELAPLQNHPALRVIRLIRYRPGTPVPSAQQVAEIRGDLGATIEVR